MFSPKFSKNANCDQLIKIYVALFFFQFNFKYNMQGIIFFLNLLNQRGFLTIHRPVKRKKYLISFLF